MQYLALPASTSPQMNCPVRNRNFHSFAAMRRHWYECRSVMPARPDKMTVTGNSAPGCAASAGKRSGGGAGEASAGFADTTTTAEQRNRRNPETIRKMCGIPFSRGHHGVFTGRTDLLRNLVFDSKSAPLLADLQARLFEWCKPPARAP
jgi:hypothetical protein